MPPSQSQCSPPLKDCSPGNTPSVNYKFVCNNSNRYNIHPYAMKPYCIVYKNSN